jgi:hypothetical protein
MTQGRAFPDVQAPPERAPAGEVVRTTGPPGQHVDRAGQRRASVPVNLSDPLDHDLLAFALLNRDSVAAANALFSAIRWSPERSFFSPSRVGRSGPETPLNE